MEFLCFEKDERKYQVTLEAAAAAPLEIYISSSAAAVPLQERYRRG